MQFPSRFVLLLNPMEACKCSGRLRNIHRTLQPPLRSIPLQTSAERSNLHTGLLLCNTTMEALKLLQTSAVFSAGCRHQNRLQNSFYSLHTGFVDEPLITHLTNNCYFKLSCIPAVLPKMSKFNYILIGLKYYLKFKYIAIHFYSKLTKNYYQF